MEFKVIINFQQSSQTAQKSRKYRSRHNAKMYQRFRNNEISQLGLAIIDAHVASLSFTPFSYRLRALSYVISCK